MPSVKGGIAAAIAAMLIDLPVGGVAAHGLEVETAVTPVTDVAGNDQKIFLTILNEAFHAEYLYKASSPVAERIELHRSLNDTRMAPVERIEIPLDGRLDMRRSGYHLMLVGVKRRLVPGEEVPITLTFGEGRQQKVVLAVGAIGDVQR